MSTRSLLLSLIPFALSQNIVPECNYAATGTFHYPIGACDTDVNATTGDIISFKYICNSNYTINQEIYSKFDCYGEPDAIITNQTELNLEHYECNSTYGDCPYAIGCAIQECGDDSGCDTCVGSSIQSLLQTQNTHCFPYITGQCFGFPGFLQQSVCANGVLSESFYFGSVCNDTYYGYNDTFGGDSATCRDPNGDDIYTYYDIDCTPTVLKPDCNFAAAGAHFYPIGACETDTNAESEEIISFKYDCTSDDEIEKYVYSTYDCYGEPDEIIAMSELSELDHHECNAYNGDCPYAVSCSFVGCDDECGACSEASELELITNYDTQCRPYIVDECIGNEGELLQYATCSDDLLTENLYFGTECTNTNYLFNELRGGEGDGKCIASDDDETATYYTTECNPTIIPPECNYAATGSHFYPIGACESGIEVGDTETTKYSFKYICTDEGKIAKYTYSDIDCQDDDKLETTTPTDIEHYECEASRDCDYAIGCSYSDCNKNTNDTSCSVCSETNYISNYKQNHNTHCLPTITNQCFGLKDELLHSSTCVGGVLSENFYYGRECIDDTFVFPDEFGGDESTCKWGSYYEIECVLAPTSFPTESPTAEDIDDSEANIISVFVALICGNIILFINM